MGAGEAEGSNQCVMREAAFDAYDRVFRTKSAIDSGIKSATGSDVISATPVRGGKRSTDGR